MLEHGARADEVHILLRKRVAPQIFNERAQSASLTRSQYDAATSWNLRFQDEVSKIISEIVEQFSSQKSTGTYLYFDARCVQEFFLLAR